MNILITVLARKGSKRLPNKHLLEFNGRPLIEWTLLQIRELKQRWLNSELSLADAIVSSDSQDILDVARKQKFHTYLRKPQLAGDKVYKLDSIREAMGKQDYDVVIDLDVTNPCRTPRHIVESFEIFQEKRPDVLYSVTKARKSPFFNQISRDSRKLVLHSKKIPCMQDSPTIYDMNSNIYVARGKWVANSDNKSWTGARKTEFYEMPSWTAFDIDTETEFEIAEMLHYKHILGGR